MKVCEKMTNQSENHLRSAQEIKFQALSIPQNAQATERKEEEIMNSENPQNLKAEDQQRPQPENQESAFTNDIRRVTANTPA